MNKTHHTSEQDSFAGFSGREREQAEILQQALGTPTDAQQVAEIIVRRLSQTTVPQKKEQDIMTRIRRRRRCFFGQAAAAIVAFGAALSIIFALSSGSALADTISQLKSAKSLFVEIYMCAPEGGPLPPKGPVMGKTYLLGKKAFIELPDRKQWVISGKSITYFPATNRVHIQSADAKASDSSMSFSTEALIRGLEKMDLKRLPDKVEILDGREYVRVSLQHSQGSGPDIILFLDRQTNRLEHMAYCDNGRPVTWMKLTYNPVIPDGVFKPDYPKNVKVVDKTKTIIEDTAAIVQRWRAKAICAAENNEFQLGLLGVWLAPDGLLGLHVYEYNGYSGGTAFPDEVFAEHEMKGGFSIKDWYNVNALLETPAGVPHRPQRSVPHYPNAVPRKKSRPLIERRYFFQLPDAPDSSQLQEISLHLWKLRQPLTRFDWRKGYSSNKDNYAYIVLRIPLPEQRTEMPSEEFIKGIHPTGPNQLVFRVWLLERNGGKEEALQLIDNEPVEAQHAMAWTKLRLLKELGKEKELMAFLQVHIKWMKEHDNLHASNIPRLIARFAPPEFEKGE